MKPLNGNLPSFYNFVHPLYLNSLVELHKKCNYLFILLKITILLKVLEPKTIKNINRLLLALLCPNCSIQLVHFIFIQNENLIEGICQQINEMEALALQKTNWIYNNENQKEIQKRIKDFNNNTKINNKIIKEEKNKNLVQNKSENKKDLNNNNIETFNFEWSIESKQNINSNTFDELPSLSTLPELDDKDLDEFFRLVEQ
uniref:Uncharacterized protein n=1 Tax=Meloidogyne hapla TaxID=6305 RepID=A0A1I8BVD7_MELHA